MSNYEEARDQIAEFLETLAGKLRPIDVDIDADGEETTKETNSVIQEWMVLITWSDLETGDSYTSWVSPSMIPSHQVGLLTMVCDAIMSN